MLTREKIQIAIQCNGWQAFRLSLKGTTTKQKLELLKAYLLEGAVCCSKETRYVQVYNYLNALSRGGQIEPVALGDELETDRVIIRR